ncbi:MAG: C39 family peptidase [Chloroflexota bacterium]
MSDLYSTTPFQSELPSDLNQPQIPEVPVQTDTLPNGTEVTVYGNWLNDERFNHLQGKNTYDFQDDCGLVSIQDVLLQHGINATESDVVSHAVANSECDLATSSDSGGETSPMQQAEILNDYGLQAQTETNGTLDTLASQVQSGDQVILSVNAGVLWNESQYYGNGDYNHAVTVTGVVRDTQTNQVIGFVVNDSGQGKTELVDANTMQQAWVNPGGVAVVVG